MDKWYKCNPYINPPYAAIYHAKILGETLYREFGIYWPSNSLLSISANDKKVMQIRGKLIFFAKYMNAQFTIYVFEYEEGYLIICLGENPYMSKSIRDTTDDSYIYFRPITDDKSHWHISNNIINKKDEIPDIFTWRERWNTICNKGDYYSHEIPRDLKLLIREYI